MGDPTDLDAPRTYLSAAHHAAIMQKLRAMVDDFALQLDALDICSQVELTCRVPGVVLTISVRDMAPGEMP
ncbi:hypothetical protein ACQW02_19800 [Humitalea sp. 24SJ18S-53]|uniref:hypothetical protein n=1 Tax=Humitalea sp. 24SJ18S-53 TaxID=3422307 RepID=UPI003D67EB8B